MTDDKTAVMWAKSISVDKKDFTQILRPILSNKTIFGLDLFEAGIAETVAGYFGELVAGKGAVRATLKKYTA